MGKEMEEAGNEYTCPKCTEKKENEVNEKQTFQLKVKLKERQAVKSKKQPPVKSPGAGSGPAVKSPGGANKKDSTNTVDQTVSPPDKNKKQVVKKKTCFCCDKEPKEGWIYSSEECVKKHAARAIQILSRNKSKTSLISKTHVLVMEPLTNTMLNGPNAPLESNLESWLLSHPTYHAVLPSKDPGSKFYGVSTSKFYGKSKQKPPVKRYEPPPKVSSAKIMAAIQSQDEKAALAAGKKPSLTGISSSPTTKPTLAASLDQQPRVTVSSSSEKKVKTENQYTKVTPPKQTIKQEPEKNSKAFRVPCQVNRGTFYYFKKL
jgi:hypothetical protein